MYGFKLERTPDGWRYIKQYHHDGQTFDMSVTVQSRFAFGSYAAAVAAGEAWERGANARAEERSR